MKRLSRHMVYFVFIGLILIVTSGCSYKGTNVKTTLNLTDNGSGQRIIELELPKMSVEEYENIDQIISQNYPDWFDLEKINDNSLKYILTLNFSSKDDYVDQLTTILGYKPNVVMAEEDTIFTQGIKVIEDFESSELLKFIYLDKQSDKSEAININLKDKDTIVTYKGDKYKTKSKINLIKVEYEAVDSINIATTNNNDGTYDRIIEFYLPKDTVNDLSEGLSYYFSARAGHNADILWLDIDNGKKVSIAYYNIPIDVLKEETNRLMNIYSHDVIYAEDRKNSNIFDKKSSFTESIDTSSYTAKKGKNVKLDYSYKCISSELINGEIYNNGTYSEIGKIENNIYRVTIEEPKTKLKVSNHEYYQAKAVNHYLSMEDDEKYTREIEFIYDSADQDKLEYILDYLNDFSDVFVGHSRVGGDLICKLSIPGDIDKISSKLQEIIGDGNSLTYKEDSALFSAYSHVELKDTIKMQNLNPNYIPMKYTVYLSSKINLNEISCITDNIEEKVDLSSDNRQSIDFELKSNDAVIRYSSKKLNVIGIISIVLVVFIVLAIGVIFIKRAFKKNQNKNIDNKSKNN